MFWGKHSDYQNKIRDMFHKKLYNDVSNLFGLNVSILAFDVLK